MVITRWVVILLLLNMATSARNVQQFFPFSSKYSTWEDWNGNFVIWYGEENLPQEPEDNWRSVAQHIASVTTFLAYPIPSPDKFENWQDWADEVSLSINGPSR